MAMEELENWSLLEKLPKQVEGFTLDLTKKEVGRRITFFTYTYQLKRQKVIGLYDLDTKDYMVRVIAGLNEYFDVHYIHSSQSGFEKVITERFPRTLCQLAVFKPENLESLITDTGVLDWAYGHELPKQYGAFELYIPPYEPFQVINGSYIVLDYSDFARESNLLIYYNVYRDEFFGEIRIFRTPEMTLKFDAKNIHELKVKLDENLISTLDWIEQRLQRNQ